jgi:hypothetical protein
VTENENNYTCREGSEADFEKLAEFFERHDYAPKHLNWSTVDYLDWLRWKFLGNPDGPGRVFILEDAKGTVIGFRASMPRQYTSAATGTFFAYQGADALTDINQRKKGLYMKLWRFTSPLLELPSVSFPRSFIFDAAIRRGDPPIGPTQKWWFPVALGRSIETPWKFLIPLANAYARIYTILFLGTHPKDLEMRPLTRFDRDFEIDPGLIHGVRSADYLNWRFIDNPMYDYSPYEFFENDKSIGYCVYTVVHSKAEIYDFVIGRRHRGCLRLLVEHLRNKEIVHMRFRGIGLRLGKYGFIRRRDPINNCKATQDVPQGAWILTMADRDY